MAASVKGVGAGTGPRPGAHVYLRWGLDVVEGVVVDRYEGVSGGDRVVVRPSLDDADSPTVSVPESDLLSAEDAEAAGPPGTWVHAAKYDRRLDNALGRILKRFSPHILKPAIVGDQRYDYLVDLGDVQLAVEEKFVHRGEITERIAQQIINHLGHLTRARKMVVSNADFSPAAARRLRARHIEPVTWRTGKDDTALAAGVTAAVG